MKKDSIREVCVKCRAACCKLGGTDFSRTEMLRVLRRGYQDYFVKIGRNHYELRCKRGICPYLQKDNTCAINDIKPLACRSWPVYPRGSAKGKTEYLLLGCPLASHLTEADVKVMRRQAGHAKGVLKTSFSASRIPSADMRLVRKRFNKFPKSHL